MTHTGPMPESDGTFTSDTLGIRPCERCKLPTAHREQCWESNCGGYTDYKYTCTECDTVHWVDGPDA